MVVGMQDACLFTVKGLNPTGTVSWSSRGGSFSVPQCLISHGTCAVVFTPTSAGSLTVAASYGGDSDNLPGTASVDLQVDWKATTTVVSCTPRSAEAGSVTTFDCTAKVRGYLPTGTVTWSQEGPASVSFATSTCALSMGSCSVTLTGTPPVKAAVHAGYGGDLNNAPSSGTHRLNLERAMTTVTIACSSTTPSAGMSVTCMATVQNGYFPTGKVVWAQVSGDGQVIFSSRTCTLSPLGNCEVKITAIDVGGVKIRAVYVGDSNNRARLGATVLTVT
jgi:hypothetical protein